MTETTVFGQVTTGHFLTSPYSVSWIVQVDPFLPTPAWRCPHVGSFATTLAREHYCPCATDEASPLVGSGFPPTSPTPLSASFAGPFLPNLSKLASPRNPTWGLSSPRSVSSLHANNSQPDLALRASNGTGPKRNSPSLQSLPPKSIFPSVVCIL